MELFCSRLEGALIMDLMVMSLPKVIDGDLAICETQGLAYQADPTQGRVSYDSAYWAKVNAYEGSDIQKLVLEGRLGLLRKWSPMGSKVFDVGAGTGAFVRAARFAGYDAVGHDVMLEARRALEEDGLYCPTGRAGAMDVVTLWDTIEHLDDPHLIPLAMRAGALLMVSVPLFKDIKDIRPSKHYRPGEHLYYFTFEGFVWWANSLRLSLLDYSDHETAAGRDSIGAFVFRKESSDGA